MWRCKKKETIIWADSVKNKTLFHGVKEERNIPHKTKRRKGNWIGHILRDNRLLKYISAGKIEGLGRGGRRCKEQLDNR